MLICKRRLFCVTTYFLILLEASVHGTIQKRHSEKVITKCANGQEISMDNLCDGVVHCLDKSDETVSACLHTVCPAYAFQCAYGGCISGNAECNSIKDCVDNSDETTLRCYSEQQSTINGNCSTDGFQCWSGECIQQEEICDGKKDCVDGSDETVALCSHRSCPSFAFKCGYGACVRGDAACDGVSDCLDSSDELQRLCGDEYTSMEELNPANIPSITTTTEEARPLSGGECLVECIPQMKFAKISFHGARRVLPGSMVSSGSTIAYKCLPRYKLEGTESNICGNGTWLLPSPECSAQCFSEHLSGTTLTATCEYNGMQSDCTKTVKAGTRAKLTCKSGHQKPDKIQYDTLTCMDNGLWDRKPFRCQLVCGIYEDASENSLPPWNVAIYSKFYEYLCRGTLINARVVLSSARCLWDRMQNKTRAFQNFRVAIGKYYKYYFAEESNPVQFFNLTEIYIPPEFQGADLFYHYDIAILVLDSSVTFTDNIRPICIDWQNFRHRAKDRSNLNRTGTWGNFDGDKSIAVRSVSFNIVDYEECRSRIPTEVRDYVTSDKFCVESPDNTTFAKVDCGAGFATQKRKNSNKYFLSGIVSHDVTNDVIANGYYAAVCTNMKHYAFIIHEYYTKYNKLR